MIKTESGLFMVIQSDAEMVSTARALILDKRKSMSDEEIGRQCGDVWSRINAFLINAPTRPGIYSPLAVRILQRLGSAKVRAVWEVHFPDDAGT